LNITGALTVAGQNLNVLQAGASAHNIRMSDNELAAHLGDMMQLFNIELTRLQQKYGYGIARKEDPFNLNQLENQLNYVTDSYRDLDSQIDSNKITSDQARKHVKFTTKFFSQTVTDFLHVKNNCKSLYVF